VTGEKIPGRDPLLYSDYSYSFSKDAAGKWCNGIWGRFMNGRIEARGPIVLLETPSGSAKATRRDPERRFGVIIY